MKGLSDFEKMCEQSFGLISGGMLFGLWECATAAGAQWKLDDPDTMEIPVNERNAADVYGWCRAIRSGYSVGLNKKQYALVKEARKEAHKFLCAEAQDPNTTIERKIELVKLTSKDWNVI